MGIVRLREREVSMPWKIGTKQTMKAVEQG